MFSRFNVVSVVLAVTSVALSTAWAAETVCPESYAPELGKLVLGEHAWVGFAPRPLPLTAAGFMQGEPAMLADLKPSSSKKIADGTAVQWSFAGHYPQGKWLSCDYANGLFSLSRQIPDGTSECTVFYRNAGKGQQRVREIVCK